MTVKDYLLKNTKVHELYLIRENGIPLETVYIDWEDLFMSAVTTRDREVKEVIITALQIRDSNNGLSFAPATILEV